jgi:ATP-dependent Clp protease ATP-binding subunit ClpC
MFERFTADARQVIVGAQQEARSRHHDHIGTEHLLLAVAGQEQTEAAKALDSLGISRVDVRSRLTELVGQGECEPSGHIPFSTGAKKVLELSLRESQQLGHDYIGTEHILLGLVREGDGVAARLLVELGAELTLVQRQVVELNRSGE